MQINTNTINRNSIIHRKSFALYLRRGIPFDISIKSEQKLPEKYIWRTSGDAKVRISHAENNGKVFDINNPPDVGNPGEDYNCRCKAEPYIKGKSEFASQTIKINTNPNKIPKGEEWGNYDFVYHFYFGEGKTVDLAEKGNLQSVIDYYFYKLGKSEDIKAQIIDEARKSPSGFFTYDFKNSYKFKPLLYSYGWGIVSGLFTGVVEHKNGTMYISGEIDYKYYDEFTDIVSIREVLFGTSDQDKVSKIIIALTDGLLADPYKVIGRWKTSFEAEAKFDEDKSIYK